jgi:hypothetical protein
MQASALFDPGLQPERTELAWRRTTLSLAVGSLLSLRLLPDTLGDALWVTPGAVLALMSGCLWLAARSVARRRCRALLRGELTNGMPGGGILFGLAIVTAGLGLLALILVLAA